MRNRAKIIWIITGTVLTGIGFWLWWRQKDAVPPSAVPILQQAKAVLSEVNSPSQSTTTPPSDTKVLSTVFPDYIPLPDNSNTV